MADSMIAAVEVVARNAVSQGMQEAVTSVRDGMAELVRSVSDGMKGIAESVEPANEAMAGVGKAARHAETESHGLLGVLREHRAEMRAESGVARQLARDLSLFGLEAKGAGGEIAHVVSALSFGGGLGIALAGLSIVQGAWKELKEEEQKTEENAKRAAEELVRIGNRIRNLRAELAGVKPEALSRLGAIEATETIIRKYEHLEEVAKAAQKAEIAAVNLNQNTPSEDNAEAAASAFEAAKAARAELAKYEKEVVETAGGIDILRRRLKALKEEQGLAVKVDKKGEDEQAENDAKAQRKVNEEHNQAILRSRAELAQGEDKIELERQAQVAAVQAKEKLSEAQKAAEIELINEIANAKILASRERLLQESRKLVAQQEEAEAAALREQIEEGKRLTAYQKQEKAKKDAEDQRLSMEHVRQEVANLRQLQASTRQFIQPLAGSFRSVLSGILSGTMDLANVWRSVWQGMASFAADALTRVAENAAVSFITEKLQKSAEATAEIAASAAAGGAAAAAAAAPLFFWNPAGAVAIGEAMSASIDAAFMPQASLAVGTWRVPHDMVAKIHRDEAVVPATFMDAVRSGQATIGGTGGGGTTINNYNTINALDGPSVYRVLNNNASQANRFHNEQVAAGRR